jgi:2-hydroxychromene-2-carboxylate isomerase
VLPAAPTFYYDLGDPSCYLMAERIMSALPAVPEWEPVLAQQFGGLQHEPDWRSIEQLLAAYELQPLRRPERWPPDSRTAMLAATYAKKIGRGVAFSLAAFRQEFAGGRDLGLHDTVLIAAAACEMHPASLLKAIELRSCSEGLERAGRRALEAGAKSLPAIQVGDDVFYAIDDAVQALV